MPKDMREPQSYGSDTDWVSGKTGGQVNDQKSRPASGEREFYDDRRESETSASYQGGKNSPVQLAENVQGASGGDDPSVPTQRVSTEAGGARRDSFFKRRDYK